MFAHLKTFAAVAAFASLSTLAACGGEDAAPETAAPTPNNTASATQSDAPSASQTPSTTPTTSASPTTSTPSTTASTAPTLKVPNPAQELYKKGKVTPKTHDLVINAEGNASAMFLAQDNKSTGETTIAVNCAKESELALRIMPQDKQIDFPGNKCVPGKPVIVTLNDLKKPVASLEVDLTTLVDYTVAVFVKR